MKSLTKYTYDKVDAPESLRTGALSQISPLLLNIAYKRGYQTKEELEGFLIGNLDRVLSETMMQGTQEALVILKDAIKNKDLIVVYQDYDVDGCTAGAICLECVRKLGGKIESYVNIRELDGYGICKHGIDQIKELHPEAKIIMTVDNGIVANEAVAYAKSLGYQVIITDHHLPGSELPEADAVIDPKRKDEFYSFRDLCGAGVAFKLMLALADYMDRDAAPIIQSLDLVGFATVSDVVPLIGENRDIVREALRMMNENPRPSIAKMQELTEIDEITSHTIGFVFGPMVNALSRMGEDAYLATKVLISDDEKLLEDNIQFLIQNNNDRKEETKTETELAMSMVDLDNLPSAIILKHDSFKEGIIGIVAGRMKNEFHRPSIVFAPTDDPNILKASCRSIDAFHLKENLDKMSGLLLGYGGHANAAGLSIQAENFDKFKDMFIKMTDQLDPECFIEKLPLDEVLDANDVTVDAIKEIRMLEPYGEGNQPPLFGLRFIYDAVRYMGENGKHVKYWVKNNNMSIIEWNGGDTEKQRQERGVRRTKVIGSLSLNVFRETVSPQFIVKN